MSSNKPVGAPAALKSVFIAPDRKLRAVWRLIILLVLWYGISALSVFGLSRLLMRMLNSWGVTSANLYLAPGWVQYLAAYQTGIYRCAAALVAAVAGALLTGRLGKGIFRSAAGALIGFLASVLTAMILAGLFLLTDSMRAYTHSAGVTADTFIMLAVYAVAAAAEGVLAFGYVRDMAASRGGRLAGYAAGSAMFLAMDGLSAAGAVGIINLILMALVLCFVAERAGIAPAIGLRAGWLWATGALAGFTGSETAILRLYPVSENLLTGGASGPASGLMFTLICAAAVLPTLGKPALRSIKTRLKTPKK